MVKSWRHRARLVPVAIALAAITLVAAAVITWSYKKVRAKASWAQLQTEMEHRLAGSPGDAVAWVRLAVARYGLGAYGDAVCSAEKAGELGTGSGEVWREYSIVMVESWERAQSPPVKECFRQRTKTGATRLLKLCEESAPDSMSTGTYLENCRSAIAFFGWIGEEEQRRKAYTMALKRAREAAESSSATERQTGEDYLKALSQIPGLVSPGDKASPK